MNLTKVYHNFIEINGDPCLASTIVRNTDPIVKNTNTAKLALRSGVVYHKRSKEEPYFSFDNTIRFSVDKCILEKRNKKIFLLGVSDISEYVLFSVGSISEKDLL